MRPKKSKHNSWHQFTASSLKLLQHHFPVHLWIFGRIDGRIFNPSVLIRHCHTDDGHFYHLWKEWIAHVGATTKDFHIGADDATSTGKGDKLGSNLKTIVLHKSQIGKYKTQFWWLYDIYI